ncbi:MAG: hypothetical protein A2Y25_02900 [Candidatus Melainabacteria bacterium GWF2_37_15]|nr:MAG: hypothetical protein A2Y25_02900 [Candidatus Melainabacteria bacterium GWF2_37_15]
MYCDGGKVFVEKEDQCMSCKNFKKGVECPLLQALGFGVVTLEGTLYVTNCGFYSEYKRHLNLVNEIKTDEE